MYKVGYLEFEGEVFSGPEDFCRACGVGLTTWTANWECTGGSPQGKTEHLITVPDEGGFVSISGVAYRVCDRCLEALQGDTELPVIIRLLHPELQRLLPKFQHVDESDRDLIIEATKIGVSIDRAVEEEDDC